MDFFQSTMRVLSAVLMVYYFIIILRVILSWFPSSSPGVNQFKQLIHKITEPYMGRFNGISWLKFGMLDFSPVLGLIILSFLLFITQRLSIGNFPSIGELLIWIISMVWGIFAFLVTIVAVVMIFRFITLYAMKGSRPNWIDRIDAFIFPRVSRIMGMFTSKTVSYPVALAISAVMLLVFRFGIDALLNRVLYPLIIQI